MKPPLLAWLALTATAISLGAQKATAQTSHAARKPSLSWVRAPGAEGCPAAPAVARALQAVIGPTLVPASDADVSIEASVVPAEARPAAARPGMHTHTGFVARALVTDGSGAIMGRRQWVVGDDCEAVLEQVVFVVGVTLDPTFLERMSQQLALDTEGDEPGRALLAELEQEQTRQEPAARTPGPLNGQEPTVPRDLGQLKAPAGSSREQVPGLSLLGELLLTGGVQPGIVPGAGLGTRWTERHWSVGVRVSALWPASVSLPAAAARASLTTLGLRPSVCWLPLMDSVWRAGVCAGASLQLQWGAGQGLAQTAHAVRLLAGLGPELQLRLGPPALGLAVRGGVNVYPARPRWLVGESGASLQAHRTPALVGHVALGVDAQL